METLALLMSSRHLGTSVVMKSARPCGVWSFAATMPCERSACSTAGSDSATLNAWFKVFTTSAGVPLGATMPKKTLTS
ncbi:hypothetical protein D3C78_1935480 [compost metagenome]